MNTHSPDGADSRLKTLFLSVALFWTAVIAALAAWNYWQSSATMFEIARATANQSYSKDLVYRRWSAMHGGVYVPVTPETPPNPYLPDVPERDIQTPSGKKLTLINPAYMTRQVHELGKKDYGPIGHITSLKPIRPENAPDEWESSALRAFEQGQPEVSALAPIDAVTYVRFMRPLVTEAGCLKCHAPQGYRIGEIRGGISVSLPWPPYAAALRSQLIVILLGYGGIWALGMGVLLMGRKRLLHDLAERRRAEEEQKKRTTFIETLLESAPIGFAVNTIDDGQRVYVSRSFESIYGVPQGSIHSVADYFEKVYLDPAFREQIRERIMADMATGDASRMRWEDIPLTTHTGEQKVVTAINIPLLEQNLMISTVQDVTQRWRAEESRRKSEALYHDLVETSQDLIWQCDNDGRYTYLNPAWEEVFGYRVEEMLGKRFSDFQTAEMAERDRREFARLMQDQTVRGFETVHIGKAGNEIQLIFNAKFLTDAHGGVVGTRGTAYDITERKRAEKEKRGLEERLQRAEKMEALGQLAGGVAHDLNNVLGILSGYSELLLEESPAGSRSRGFVDKILQSTEKGAAIIQDLLTLARRGVTASEVVNLNGIVSDFLKTPMFERMKDYNPRVTFRAECQQSLLNIKGSPVHLEKTLMNLVANAAESISGTGEVTIRTESRYIDMPVRGYDEVKEGDYAVLTVSDTGTGIPPENREKIFDPFYTTKAMGRSGTGLGLAIVWGTVKDHQGYIDLQTEVGRGTTFTLFFPATREERAAPPLKTPIEQYLGKGESVLVVDDIAEQREIATDLLSRLGYQVRAVSSGEEAVEHLKTNHADSLVLDMIMTPGIDGLETYQKVLQISPKQKAIIVSGFSETARVTEAQKLGAGAYVKKPYVMEKIGMAIRDELSR